MKVTRLKKLLTYDPLSGTFTWNLDRGGPRRAGSSAGSDMISRAGILYSQIRVDGKAYRAHRLAWLYVNGTFPLNGIDHIDGDGKNNSIANLREATHAENAKNMKRYKTNSTGVTGVSRNKTGKEFRAKITVAGESIYLGRFSTLSSAADARAAAEKKYGFHPNHGDDRNRAY